MPLRFELVASNAILTGSAEVTPSLGIYEQNPQQSWIQFSQPVLEILTRFPSVDSSKPRDWIFHPRSRLRYFTDFSV
jgi:hypothetical protein